MPYVFYDELPEGLEAAEAVSTKDYDELVNKNADLASQLDQMGRDLREARKKYADAFTTANKVVKRHDTDTRKDSGPHSFTELFAKRTGDGNAH